MIRARNIPTYNYVMENIILRAWAEGRVVLCGVVRIYLRWNCWESVIDGLYGGGQTRAKMVLGEPTTSFLIFLV